MEKLINKISEIFTNWLDDFESKPVKTGLKVLVVLYVLKYVYKKFFEESK